MEAAAFFVGFSSSATVDGAKYFRWRIASSPLRAPVWTGNVFRCARHGCSLVGIALHFNLGWVIKLGAKKWRLGL